MEKPIKITLYHATWCGHCVSFMPTWNEMMNDKKMCKNIKFVSYESSMLNTLPESERTIKGEEISGYPTIRITINGEDYYYEGSRTKNDILQFILNKLKRQDTSMSAASELSVSES